MQYRATNNAISFITRIIFDVTAIYQSLLILMANEYTQYPIINQILSSSFENTIGRNLNFFILAKSTFCT